VPGPAPRRFTDPAGAEDIRKAVATCRRCPVARACLETALARPAETDVGIWGGTTEDKRRHLRHGDPPRHHGRNMTPAPAQLVNRHDTDPEPVEAGARRADRLAKPSRPVRRVPLPEVTLGRDTNGDYTDATGRVIAFRIHGDPPYMLMVDGRCVARTPTLTEARQRAWTALNAATAPPTVGEPLRAAAEIPSRRGSR
jgi:hypothetical protein